MIFETISGLNFFEGLYFTLTGVKCAWIYRVNLVMCFDLYLADDEVLKKVVHTAPPPSSAHSALSHVSIQFYKEGLWLAPALADFAI